MKLSHPALMTLLQKAYSGEKAAAMAYIGHAASLRSPAAKAAVKPIEADGLGASRGSPDPARGAASRPLTWSVPLLA